MTNSGATGFLVIDKPAGMTSHDVVGKVRRALGTRKVGHAGTLDPMATGVLVVAVGWATRLLEVVVSDSKGYDAVIELGRTTDTDDVTGATLETYATPLPDQVAIEQALANFRGQIMQKPPIYSAIKQQGQPVYKKARAGETVTLPERPVTISELEILDYTAPFLKLRVECGSGTYIRSLARDLGVTLGCGGTLAALERWRSGHWMLEQAIPLENVTLDALLPLEIILPWTPHLEITDEEEYIKIYQGLPLDGTRESSEPLPLVIYQGKIVAMLRFKDNQWWPRKVNPLTSSV
jgi:tRNA pseudouridine55 synthase